VAIEKKGGRGPHTQIRLLQIDTFFSWKSWEKKSGKSVTRADSLRRIQTHFLSFPDEMCAGAAATDDVPIMRALNAQFPFTLFYAALRIIPFSPIVINSATPLPGNQTPAFCYRFVALTHLGIRTLPSPGRRNVA